MIKQNSCNNNINSPASKNNRSRPYPLFDWLVRVPETNMVTMNIWFTMVGLPPSILQKKLYTTNSLLMLTYHLFLWSEVKCLDWIPSNYVLMLWNIRPKIKTERIENSPTTNWWLWTTWQSSTTIHNLRCQCDFLRFHHTWINNLFLLSEIVSGL